MEEKLEAIWDFLENKNRGDVNLFHLIVNTAKSWPEKTPENAVNSAVDLLHQIVIEIDAGKR
jgi:hypothetical protein